MSNVKVIFQAYNNMWEIWDQEHKLGLGFFPTQELAERYAKNEKYLDEMRVMVKNPNYFKKSS